MLKTALGLAVLCGSLSSALAQPRRPPPPAAAPPRGHRGVELCAVAPENEAATLRCPPGMHIVHVGFASYGTPEGSCGRQLPSACHASASRALVEEQCLGRASCAVPAANAVFGDPCEGTVKRLSLQLTCSR